MPQWRYSSKRRQRYRARARCISWDESLPQGRNIAICNAIISRKEGQLFFQARSATITLRLRHMEDTTGKTSAKNHNKGGGGNIVKSQRPPPTQMLYSFKRCTAERAHVFLQKSNIRLRVINRQLCIKERTDTKMRFCTIFIHRGKWRLAMKKLSFSEEQFGGK